MQDSGAFSGALENRPALTDRFEVLSALGDGAAGFVYHARDRQNGNKEVALKVLANDAAFDEATLDRFIAELKLCQQIRHPNVVEAYDLIQLDDTVAYTMEYVDGGSLQSIFANRHIGYEAVDRIFEQVLDGVQALHDRGVIHRDIKLENILVRTDGIVKLTDLGLMKQLGQKGLTRPGILLGTPQYMPPEYVRESKYDERGDIYTLGLMLYELVTGKRWLGHLKGQEAITYLLKTKFHVSRTALAGIPRRYSQVIERALDTRPDHRFQTAQEMKQALLAPDEVARPSLQIKSALEMHHFSKETARQIKKFEFQSLRRLLAIGLAFGIVIAALIFFMR